MTASNPKSLPAIGFLTVVADADNGLTGGYLVLNASGRPLEFHCTAPVKPNRAQEILYGPTLAPFLYGEQIGQTLIVKAKIEPLLVCTDVEPALAARPFVSSPVVLVMPRQAESASSDGVVLRLDQQHLSPPAAKSFRLHRFTLAGEELAVADGHLADKELVVGRWQPYATDFDLREPFSRIREAIEEAQRGTR